MRTTTLAPGAADEQQLSLWRGRDRWVRRFEVASHSRDGVIYVVAIDAGGAWGCSCPAWVHDPKRSPCKHISAARRH